jgi:hypothetical protein
MLDTADDRFDSLRSPTHINPKQSPSTPSLSILDLHLDRPRRRIRRHMERLHRLLELEPVRHERLEVDEPAGDEADGLWVLPCVPVLELEVDLVGGEVHEWELRIVVVS